MDHRSKHAFFSTSFCIHISNPLGVWLPRAPKVFPSHESQEAIIPRVATFQSNRESVRCRVKRATKIKQFTRLVKNIFDSCCPFAYSVYSSQRQKDKKNNHLAGCSRLLSPSVWLKETNAQSLSWPRVWFSQTFA